jgi:hypothetical protein
MDKIPGIFERPPASGIHWIDYRSSEESGSSAFGGSPALPALQGAANAGNAASGRLEVTA